jgi:PTS system nitrogen regulatory IIA component
MQLGVRDVAELLNVNERTVYRWIKEKNLPAYRVEGHYRFNRAELLEWATSERMTLSANLFDKAEDESTERYGLVDALSRGGIFYHVEGEDKESALRAVVRLMQLPEDVDRDFLYQVLLAREALASTGIGEGIAIPHVRNPIVLHVPAPTISLCFLDKPVDFGSMDRIPVYCLFTMVSPTVRMHLNLLSRLAFVLRDPGFKSLIVSHASAEEIMAEADRIEAGLLSGGGEEAR